MANNNQRSNPIYQIGLYRVLSKDECECIPCTAVSEEPKILKTPKYTTQSLLSHLARHPTFKAKYEALVKDPTPKITKFVTGPVGSLTALDRRVIHYIACTHQPFNVVNHETFRALFAAVIRQGSETMKGEKHYRELVLPRVYSLCADQIRQKLKQCAHLSFTSDIWSSMHVSFFSLTAHGIDNEWARVKYVLAVREFSGRHTADQVRELFYDLLREWDIPEEKVHCVLHDQASNMIGAFEETEVEDADCGAHKVNLLVRNAVWPQEKDPETGKMRFKKTAVTLVLTKCRNTVAHFRHSNLGFERFQQFQKQHELAEHHLIQDVATRWDSTFLMVNRMLEQRQALDSYCVQHKRDLLLSAVEWKLLEELHAFLMPLKEFSKMLCRDSSPLSVQVAVGRMIDVELRSYNGQALREERDRMQQILAEKFGDLETYKTHGVALALDPRFKDTMFTGPEAVQFRNAVVTWLSECAVEAAPPDNDERDEVLLTSSPPAKKKSVLDNIRAKFVKTTGQRPSTSQPTVSRLDYHTEFLAYLRESAVDWDSDPAVYWKANAKKFPILAPTSYLSAPATSVTSEQTFSVANVVFDSRRSRMSARKAEQLVFLNRNLPLLNYKY